MNLEKGRSKALAGFKSADLIPVDSFSWLERTESSSSAFVTIYNQDFRPKLARELVDLEQEHHDAISSLNDAYTCLSLPAQKILSGLDDLLVENPAKDPWLCELTVRHNSAQYLEHKAAYLDVLYRIYSQVRHLNGESDHKLTALSNEFVLILERFSLDFNNFPNSSTQTSTSMWQDILKEYSLDYDWKLQCPPLDGFLCTLYTHLKSLGARITINSSNSDLPKIFPETFLRFGFLQKSVSGLLSRSWQVLFAILQPATGYLHLYRAKPSGTEGNILLPSPDNHYTKSTLHDMNLHAAQFFLQSPHHPASISAQTLTPCHSVKVKNCKTVASDPFSFTFLIRGEGLKMSLRAFCEEEFVNWVIFLNENGPTASPKPKQKSIDRKNFENDKSPDIQSDSSSPQSYDSYTTTPTEASPSVSSSTIAHVPDIENPWSN